MSHDNQFEIAKIVPASSAIESEALVIVVPPFVPFSAALMKTSTKLDKSTNDKTRSQFQASILQLIRRLSSAKTAPWLTKTVFVVSPIISYNETTDSHVYLSSIRHPSQSMSMLLENTVESFLNAYLGYKTSPPKSQSVQALPMDYTRAIIRNLLVVDVETFSAKNGPLPTNKQEAEKYQPEENELRILPQGRRGVLPNMDLMFLVMLCYDRSRLTQSYYLSSQIAKSYKLVHLVTHPYRKAAKSLWHQLKEHGLPESFHAWARGMLHLLAFESILAVGPYPPHAPALDRGIDAITVQGIFQCSTDEDDLEERDRLPPRGKISPQEFSLELVTRLERVIRCLSNLHERLHHSTSLYLLPSHDRFVKHEEYLVPNLLVLIPLLIRAILIAFKKDSHFRPNFEAVGQALGITLGWTIVFSRMYHFRFRDWTPDLALDPGGASKDVPSLVTRFLLDYQPLQVYLVLLMTIWAIHKNLTPLSFFTAKARESVQFMACLLATCIHVSIAFGHVSLAFPSALLWTPLFAFPSLVDQKGKKFVGQFFVYILFIVTCPFTFLVPCIFPTYTPYVRYAYVPLHLLFSILYVFPPTAENKAES
jgi:glycosylphosphatidylinositol transamidase